MTVLRDILARFGVQVDAGPLLALDAGIGAVVGQLQGLGQALAAGFAVQGLANFVDSTVNAADELNDLSQRLNVNTESLQAWGLAAGLNGLSAEEMHHGLGILQRSLGQAVTGNSTARQAFHRLGVEIRGADGATRDLDAVFLDVAESIARTEDPARRAALAQSVFGRSGATLVPLLAQGREGLVALRAEYRRLGGGASREMIARSAELNDNMDRLDLATFSLRTRLVNLLLPTLISASERAIWLAGAFIEAADKSHVLEAAIVVLGTIAVVAGLSVAAAWAGPILVFGLVAAAVIFLILLVDDLITLFSGGTSVIGGFIDEMFGIGAATEMVEYLTAAWEGLTMAVGEAWDAVAGFFDMAMPDRVGDEALTHTRGLDPATGITAEEGERRAAHRRTPWAEAGEAALARAGAVAESGRIAEASIPSGSGTVSRTTIATIASPLTINAPPGTDTEYMARTVSRVLDERNRAAAAAIAHEAEVVD